jgi:spore coat protein U-like protein
MKAMRIGKPILVLTTIGVLVVGSDSPVAAGTATANLQINATVSANCTISTVTVAFPAYDPIVANASVNDDGTGSVTVACTKGTGTSIALSLGANFSVTQPRMTGPGAADYLNYSLFSDSSRSVLWSGVTRAIAAAPGRAPQIFTVYGRIPFGQDISAGAYTDTVVATINF